MSTRDPMMLTISKDLPALRKGRLTSAHIARWCAAQENWDKIHYDRQYAQEIAGLPDIVINGALKQHLLTQFLIEAFDGKAWIWRLSFKFTGTDLVGQALCVEGRIKDESRSEGRRFLKIDLGIRNETTGQITTEAEAEVILSDSGEPINDALWCRSDEAPSPEQPDDPNLPPDIAASVGKVIETLSAKLPLELSRLRLFAAAVMGVRPEHYDPKAGRTSVWGTVVAFPLFPAHALLQWPDEFRLSDAPDAIGREGVAEIGRDLASKFNLPPQGLLNGGSRVQVHSLLHLGEYAEGTSRLLSAKYRTGRRGGPMLVLETLNEYRERSGRPLLTERQTIIQRLSKEGNS